MSYFVRKKESSEMQIQKPKTPNNEISISPTAAFLF